MTRAQPTTLLLSLSLSLSLPFLVFAACSEVAPGARAPAAGTGAPSQTLDGSADGATCLAAGQGWASAALELTHTTHLDCCEGLSPAEAYDDFARRTDNRCLVTKGGLTKCIRCGDGACGPGENSCNCPEDCR